MDDNNNKINLENIENEAKESIIASTKVKLIMKLEDPTDTYNLFESIPKDSKK
jgi:hypothetical protein